MAFIRLKKQKDTTGRITGEYLYLVKTDWIPATGTAPGRAKQIHLGYIGRAEDHPGLLPQKGLTEAEATAREETALGIIKKNIAEGVTSPRSQRKTGGSKKPGKRATKKPTKRPMTTSSPPTAGKKEVTAEPTPSATTEMEPPTPTKRSKTIAKDVRSSRPGLLKADDLDDRNLETALMAMRALRDTQGLTKGEQRRLLELQSESTRRRVRDHRVGRNVPDGPTHPESGRFRGGGLTAGKGSDLPGGNIPKTKTLAVSRSSKPASRLLTIRAPKEATPTEPKTRVEDVPKAAPIQATRKGLLKADDLADDQLSDEIAMLKKEGMVKGKRKSRLSNADKRRLLELESEARRRSGRDHRAGRNLPDGPGHPENQRQRGGGIGTGRGSELPGGNVPKGGQAEKPKIVEQISAEEAETVAKARRDAASVTDDDLVEERALLAKIDGFGVPLTKSGTGFNQAGLRKLSDEDFAELEATMLELDALRRARGFSGSPVLLASIERRKKWRKLAVDPAVKSVSKGLTTKQRAARAFLNDSVPEFRERVKSSADDQLDVFESEINASIERGADPGMDRAKLDVIKDERGGRAREVTKETAKREATAKPTTEKPPTAAEIEADRRKVEEQEAAERFVKVGPSPFETEALDTLQEIGVPADRKTGFDQEALAKLSDDDFDELELAIDKLDSARRQRGAPGSPILKASVARSREERETPEAFGERLAGKDFTGKDFQDAARARFGATGKNIADARRAFNTTREKKAAKDEPVLTRPAEGTQGAIRLEIDRNELTSSLSRFGVEPVDVRGDDGKKVTRIPLGSLARLSQEEFDATITRIGTMERHGGRLEDVFFVGDADEPVKQVREQHKAALIRRAEDEVKVAEKIGRSALAEAERYPNANRRDANADDMEVIDELSETVSVRVEGRKLIVRSEFDPSLPSQAKALGGKWDGETWTFDKRDRKDVKDLYLDTYGVFDEPVEGMATIRISQSQLGVGQTIRLGGRQIATRRGRDDDVQLGSGVRVIEGSFPGGGGSRKYPMLEGDDVVFEVRDVPVSKLKEIADTYESDDPKFKVIEIVRRPSAKKVAKEKPSAQPTRIIPFSGSRLKETGTVPSPGGLLQIDIEADPRIPESQKDDDVRFEVTVVQVDKSDRRRYVVEVDSVLGKDAAKARAEQIVAKQIAADRGRKKASKTETLKAENQAAARLMPEAAEAPPVKPVVQPDADAQRVAPVTDALDPTAEATYNLATNRLRVEFDGKPDEEIRNKMKAAGFRWHRGSSSWQTSFNVRREDVAIEIAGSVERIEIEPDFAAKAGRLKAAADRKRAQSDAAWDGSRKAVEGIPMGQPILVGHHSEARHRRDLARSDTKARKAIELHEEAKKLEDRAQTAVRKARGDSVFTVRNRVKKLEAEERGLVKLLAGRSAFGNPPPKSEEDKDHRRRQLEDVRQKLVRQRKMLEELGATVSPEKSETFTSEIETQIVDGVEHRGRLVQLKDVRKGDLVLGRGLEGPMRPLKVESNRTFSPATVPDVQKGRNYVVGGSLRQGKGGDLVFVLIDEKKEKAQAAKARRQATEKEPASANEAQKPISEKDAVQSVEKNIDATLVDLSEKLPTRGGLHRMSDVRSAIPGGTEMDDQTWAKTMLALERKGVIGMQTHNRPQDLDDEERKSAIVTEGRGTVFFVQLGRNAPSRVAEEKRRATSKKVPAAQPKKSGSSARATGTPFDEGEPLSNPRTDVPSGNLAIERRTSLNTSVTAPTHDVELDKDELVRFLKTAKATHGESVVRIDEAGMETVAVETSHVQMSRTRMNTDYKGAETVHAIDTTKGLEQARKLKGKKTLVLRKGSDAFVLVDKSTGKTVVDASIGDDASKVSQQMNIDLISEPKTLNIATSADDGAVFETPKKDLSGYLRQTPSETVTINYNTDGVIMQSEDSEGRLAIYIPPGVTGSAGQASTVVSTQFLDNAVKNQPGKDVRVRVHDEMPILVRSSYGGVSGVTLTAPLIDPKDVGKGSPLPDVHVDDAVTVDRKRLIAHLKAQATVSDSAILSVGPTGGRMRTVASNHVSMNTVDDPSISSPTSFNVPIEIKPTIKQLEGMTGDSVEIGVSRGRTGDFPHSTAVIVGDRRIYRGKTYDEGVINVAKKIKIDLSDAPSFTVDAAELRTFVKDSRKRGTKEIVIDVDGKNVHLRDLEDDSEKGLTLHAPRKDDSSILSMKNIIDIAELDQSLKGWKGSVTFDVGHVGGQPAPMLVHSEDYTRRQLIAPGIDGTTRVETVTTRRDLEERPSKPNDRTPTTAGQQAPRKKIHADTLATLREARSRQRMT